MSCLLHRTHAVSGAIANEFRALRCVKFDAVRHQDGHCGLAQQPRPDRLDASLGIEQCSRFTDDQIRGASAAQVDSWVRLPRQQRSQPTLLGRPPLVITNDGNRQRLGGYETPSVIKILAHER